MLLYNPDKSKTSILYVIEKMCRECSAMPKPSAVHCVKCHKSFVKDVMEHKCNDPKA